MIFALICPVVAITLPDLDVNKVKQIYVCSTPFLAPHAVIPKYESVYTYNKDKNANHNAHACLLPNTMCCNLNSVTNIALRHDWNTAHNNDVWYLNFSYTSIVVWNSCGVLNAIKPIVVGDGMRFIPTPSPVSIYTTANNERGQNELFYVSTCRADKYVWLIDCIACKIFSSQKAEGVQIFSPSNCLLYATFFVSNLVY